MTPSRDQLSDFHRYAICFFLIATSLGVVLRFALLQPVAWLDFGHALHAHSHTLYFGWAALGLLTLMFERVGATDRTVRALLFAIVAISAATFLAMLTGGYSRPGIIVSSVSLFAWAAAVVLFLRRARGISGVDVSFLRVGVLYLGASGVAAMARVVFLVTHAAPLYGRLAVFGFLHLFASFFVFACFGLLFSKLSFDDSRVRLALRLMASVSFLTFPLGVEGGEQGVLGAIAKVAAIALLVPAAILVRELFRGASKASFGRPIQVLAILWAAKAAMEASGAFGLSELATRLHQPTILYLHVLLLGFVSGALILLLRLRFRIEAGAGFWLHQAGVGLMTASLGACSAALLLPGDVEWLMRAGLFFAAIAGALVVLAGTIWGGVILFGDRSTEPMVPQLQQEASP